MTPDTTIPRAQRASVMLSGQVYRHDRPTPTTHRILNLSSTGLGLSPADGLTVGMMVAVTVGQVEQAVAEVARVVDNMAGVRFVDPIDPIAARARRTTVGMVAPTGGWLAEVQARKW